MSIQTKDLKDEISQEIAENYKKLHRSQNNQRNIGVIAHIDSGKTTTTEALLYLAGTIRLIGKVHDGATTTDYHPLERAKGITIFAVFVQLIWERLGIDYRINLIDTPGHIDFTMEVERSLRVLDGCVVVIDGSKGVQAQTQTVWNQSNKHSVPRIIFVNKMDNAEDESDFFNSLKSIENRLRAEILVLQLPIGSGKNLRGVIDLVSEKAYYLGFGDKDEKYVEGPVPEEMIETIRVYREKLISKILENNENLFEKYFVKGSISIEEIKLAIRGMTLKSRFSPVLCGSAYRNIGVRFLLDAVVDYLPSPLDRSQFEAYELNKFNDDDSDSGYESESEDSDSSKRVVLDSKKYDKLLALVYKIVIDEYNNRLAFLRIYSGAIEPNSYVVNPTKGRQRISRLFLVQANKRKPLERAIAGDIVGVIGLDEDTTTGDTICSLESSDLILEKISFSEPVISQAIRPVTQKDRSKLPAALKKLRSQDPSFYYSINETNQMIIGGMGELHLSIMLQRLSDEEGVQVHTNSPEVAYKETISGDSSTKHFISYTHKKQSGGAGQFARVDLEFSPNENSEKFLFIDAVVGEQLPKEFRPSVKKGIEEVLSQGGKILGYPIVGVKVRLVGGAWHSVDSSNDAFKTAATDAFREIMKRDDFVMCLKEPIMKVVVENYERYEGVIISSLSSKRGKPITQEEEKGLYFEVPLSELFNYTTTLRSLTKGEASFTMTPSHYQEVPGSVVEKLKKTVN